MFDISVNLSKGKYKVSLDDRAFAGEFKTEKNTTTVTIDKIVMYDEDGEIASYITTGIKIVISESDKAPSIPKDYTTIDNIKEKDIEEWVEKIDELGE
jgi:hypothetical protein